MRRAQGEEPPVRGRGDAAYGRGTLKKLDLPDFPEDWLADGQSIYFLAAALTADTGTRFAVEVAWRDFSGGTGVGTATALTNDTGHFWFFSSSNVGVVVKVLDGRAVNGKVLALLRRALERQLHPHRHRHRRHPHLHQPRRPPRQRRRHLGVLTR